MIMVFVYVCDTHYKNFKIVGASMQLTKIPDSVSLNRQYILITLNTELCNPEYGFWKGGIEPGINGIDEDILSIHLLDTCGNDVTSSLKGWDKDEIGEGSMYYSDSDLAALCSSLNGRKDFKSKGDQIKPRLFYVDSLVSIPQELVISFKDRQVRCFIDN